MSKNDLLVKIGDIDGLFKWIEEQRLKFGPLRFIKVTRPKSYPVMIFEEGPNGPKVRVEDKQDVTLIHFNQPEPGIIKADKVENPCGEIPITDYEPCDLGKITVMKLVHATPEDIDLISYMIRGWNLDTDSNIITCYLNDGYYYTDVMDRFKKFDRYIDCTVGLEATFILEPKELRINIEEEREMITRKNLVVTKRFLERMNGEGYIWETADNREIRLSDLSDNHLENIIKLLEDCSGTIREQHLDILRSDMDALETSSEIMSRSMGKVFTAIEDALVDKKRELDMVERNKGLAYLNRMPLYNKLKAEYSKRHKEDLKEKEIKRITTEIRSLEAKRSQMKGQINTNAKNISTKEYELDQLREKAVDLHNKYNDIQYDIDRAYVSLERAKQGKFEF